MRILHCVLGLAFAILLKNVYCDSIDPLRLPSSHPSYFSSLPKPKTSPFHVPATNTQLGKGRLGAPTPPPPSPKVTSYILAVTWPPGACTGNSGIACKIKPVPTEFKIHGLWPQPDGLLSTEVFDSNELSTLTSELNKNWPNLRSEQQQVSINLIFWRDEWDKHGKYSEIRGVNPEIGQVRAYFNKTLQLYRNFGEGLKGALVAKKITPNLYATYKLQAIEAALKEIYGVSCTVVCNERNTDKKPKQIQEIRVRFTNDFKLQNNNVASSTCGTATTDVMFPALS